MDKLIFKPVSNMDRKYLSDRIGFFQATETLQAVTLVLKQHCVKTDSSRLKELQNDVEFTTHLPSTISTYLLPPVY